MFHVIRRHLCFSNLQTTPGTVAAKPFVNHNIFTFGPLGIARTGKGLSKATSFAAIQLGLCLFQDLLLLNSHSFRSAVGNIITKINS